MTGRNYTSISFETVKQAASGRWPEVHAYLGIPAHRLTGKHTDCACGGVDRFRSLNDENGGWICGQGGATTGGDGFDLLVHYGWSKADALHAVAQFFNVEKVMLTPEQRVEIQRRKRLAKQAKYEAVLSHEMHVYLQIINPRIDGRINAKDKNFRLAQPEWSQPPDEHWKREIEAANTIHHIIEQLYKEKAA